MKFPTLILGGVLVALLLPATSAIPIDCLDICLNDRHHLFHLCPCLALFSHTTHNVHPTPHSHHTTTDICDYLCSIQLGGEACHCTKPGLPGRR